MKFWVGLANLFVIILSWIKAISTVLIFSNIRLSLLFFSFIWQALGFSWMNFKIRPNCSDWKKAELGFATKYAIILLALRMIFLKPKSLAIHRKRIVCSSFSTSGGIFPNLSVICSVKMFNSSSFSMVFKSL